MARKKMKNTSQTKKASAKRQAKTAQLSQLQSMEKDFRSLPVSIAAQYAKDLATAKQQEIKLKNSLKQSQAQQKAAQAKCATLLAKATSKMSATTKKQLKAAKKSLDSLTKTMNSLVKQIDQAAKQCKMLASSQAKFTMLGKELVKLDKQWEIHAKKAAKILKKAPKKMARKVAEKSEPSELFTQQEEHISTMTPANEPAEADA